jgi:plasmid maintenance system antidote protein VapI
MGINETVGHRKLRRFLKKTTAAELAKLTGLTPMQISHLVCGRRKASLDVAVRLEKASKGKIAAKSWTLPA